MKCSVGALALWKEGTGGNFCNIGSITFFLCCMHFLPVMKITQEWNSSGALPQLSFWYGELWVSLPIISCSGGSANCASGAVSKASPEICGIQACDTRLQMQVLMLWCFFESVVPPYSQMLGCSLFTFLILVEGAGCKYLGCSWLPELCFKQRSFELELGK